MAAKHIRLATRNDLNAIGRIVEEAFSIYEPRMNKKPYPMLDDYEAHAENERAYVLTINEEVVALVVLAAEGDALSVDNLAVANSRRGQGFGRAMLDFAEKLARERGLMKLILYTNEAMSENLTFYPRMGFRETRRGVENGYKRVYYEKTFQK